MKTDIINPVSKKNVFFYNIFNKLIDSIKRFVGETEEDTFGKWFNTEYSDNKLNIVPKLNTDDALTIGNNDVYLEFKSGSNIIAIGYDDGINISMNIVNILTGNTQVTLTTDDIQVYTLIDENSLNLTIEPTDIKIKFNNDNEYTFDETKIAKVYNCVSSTDVNTIVKLTQAEYDDLEVKDKNTLYVIIPAVTYHTRVVDSDSFDNYVEIEFEQGMTWGDFVNSEYNDVTKMTVGEDTEVAVFTIDGNNNVVGCVGSNSPQIYETPQKASDLIIANIEYSGNRFDIVCYE